MVLSQRPTSKLDWRKSLAALLMLVGVCIIALSFVWPGKTTQLHAWSDTQAELYQASSARLHALSHEIANATPERQQAVKDELSKAQAEYDALRGELESALERPNRVAWAMRVVGLLGIAIGGALLYYLPDTVRHSNVVPQTFVHIKREK